jgi:hypothetical protein
MRQNEKMSGNGNDKGGEKDTKRKYIIIIVAAVVVIAALAGVIIFLLTQRNKPQAQTETNTENTGSGRDVVQSARVVLDEDSAANVMDEMREQVEEGMFECSMSMEWTFGNGHSESQDAYVENSSNNTHPIYFDVVLDGSDYVIYSSPILPVGTQLTNFKLDVPLGAGTYQAICKYTLLDDEESQTPISAANFMITINVLK